MKVLIETVEKVYVKICGKGDPPPPDGLKYDRIFWLHTYLTHGFLAICWALATATEYWGSPISCMNIKGIPNKLLNHHCWIQGIFTIPGPLRNHTGEGMPHQGIGPYFGPDHEIIEPKHHNWYMWLHLILLVQAFWYSFPHTIWSSLEGGKIHYLAQKLHLVNLEDMVEGVKDLSDEEKIKAARQRRSLVLYFVANLGKNNLYAAQYVFVEILNLLNVVAQAYIMNSALDGEFVHYGLRLPELLDKNWTEREDKFVTVRFSIKTSSYLKKFVKSQRDR